MLGPHFQGPVSALKPRAAFDPKRTIGSYIVLGTATYRWGL